MLCFLSAGSPPYSTRLRSYFSRCFKQVTLVRLGGCRLGPTATAPLFGSVLQRFHAHMEQERFEYSIRKQILASSTFQNVSYALTRTFILELLSLITVRNAQGFGIIKLNFSN